MKAPTLLLACCLTLFSTLLIRASAADGPPPAVTPASASSGFHAFDCGGEPCDAVVRGLFAFFDRKLTGLDGNGRSCADCHMLTDNFQLSPAGAEARFQALQRQRRRNPRADDPLFRPIDADDFRINGEAASDFSNLRENGLVRITFPLPPNIKLIDPATNLPSAETFVDVWRAVPTVNDVALTGPSAGGIAWPRGPQVFGGYQMDARVATLQDQALGALTNHAQVQVAPPQRMLDDLSSFQRVLFTNPRVRALSDAVREGALPLPDPDPPLDALEAQGKAVFVRACAQCHGGPEQSSPQAPVIRFHSVLSQCPRVIDTRPLDVVTPARFAFAACPPRLARNARTYEIALSAPTPSPGGLLPPGTKVRRTSSDPGRALLTGFVGGPLAPQDDWEKFDMPALRGIRNTAPYFHNNSAATLEALVDHYIEFFKRVEVVAPGHVPPPVATTNGVDFDRAPRPEERAALLAYLKKL